VNGHVEIGWVSHDGTYSIDFAVHKVPVGAFKDMAASLTDHIVAYMKEYEENCMYKFVGGGIGKTLMDLCPELPARLWAELDLVPLIFELGVEQSIEHGNGLVGVDEEADAMARKCLMQDNLLSNSQIHN